VIETELNLPINAEEHEMINVALTQLLDAADEVMGFIPDGENKNVDLLRNLRSKSYVLWSKRFEGYDTYESVPETEQDDQIDVD
jgi:hypothetical protein